ncbi:unnamed protein product [Staurois parvus]|uniref:Ig-like domain-containing protein n=1 Tax=Staurois parvus TaxID=386267 RepID=A0ABN9FJA4_9NEOB|nr:unnamed protein product [Staurois parvus]
MTCTVSGFALSDYSVHWFRQLPESKLEWIGVIWSIWHDGSIHYAESMKGRLTITRDTNKGEVYCKLTQMKPEDTAVYYCAKEATLSHLHSKCVQNYMHFHHF